MTEKTVWVDTHTHLFADQLGGDIEGVVERAQRNGVHYCMLPNIDDKTTSAMLALHHKYPKNCLPMMGIHPTSIKANYKALLNHAEKELFHSKNNYCGVGETGLDYYWDTAHKNEQQTALKMHCEWAKTLNLPLIVHTRNAFEDNIRIINTAQNGKLKGIFHCFTGTADEAQQIIDAGFLLGVGGVITFKNSGRQLREALTGISLSHMVLETDSPYLAPAPHRGKRNESSYLPIIAERLAEVKQCAVQDISAATTKNAVALFQLSVDFIEAHS